MMCRSAVTSERNWWFLSVWDQLAQRGKCLAPPNSHKSPESGATFVAFDSQEKSQCKFNRDQSLEVIY